MHSQAGRCMAHVCSLALFSDICSCPDWLWNTLFGPAHGGVHAPVALGSLWSCQALCSSLGGSLFEGVATCRSRSRRRLCSWDSFISYNEALIDERDQGIADLGQQISDVHEMFQACPRQAVGGVSFALVHLR